MDTGKKAKEFIKKYRLRKDTLTAERMKDILKSQGFMLVQYNRHGKSEEKVQALLEGLNLTDYSRGTNGFTYITSTDRIVFYNRRMSADEELDVLLHEEGHIFCDHSVRRGVAAYNDIMLEKEANEFKFNVLRNLKYQPLRGFIALCTAVLCFIGLWLTLIRV